MRQVALTAYLQNPIQTQYRLWVLLLLLLTTTPLTAAGYAVRLGPPAVGKGGPNPISLPPTALDSELSFVTTGGFEGNLSVTGLLFGNRFYSPWGGYVSLGGGLVLSGNGAGPGIYSSFGVDTWCGLVCFSLEYMQALGIASGHILSPYALRAGVILWVN